MRLPSMHFYAVNIATVHIYVDKVAYISNLYFSPEDLIRTLKEYSSPLLSASLIFIIAITFVVRIIFFI